jgi:hypothetical protein
MLASIAAAGKPARAAARSNRSSPGLDPFRNNAPQAADRIGISEQLFRFVSFAFRSAPGRFGLRPPPG